MRVRASSGDENRVGDENDAPPPRSTGQLKSRGRRSWPGVVGVLALAAFLAGCGGRGGVEAGSRPEQGPAAAGNGQPPAADTAVQKDDGPAAPPKPPADLDYGPLDLGEKFDIEAWRDGTAFVAAYGRVVGDAAIPGKPPPDDIARLAQTLAGAPNAAGVGNGVGATLRIAETGALKPGTEAAALANAMAAGSSRYAFDGRRKPTLPAEPEWKDIMAGGGVEQGVAGSFLRQTAANSEAARGARLDVLARLLQGECHAVPPLRNAYKSALEQRLPGELRPLAGDLARRAAVALLTSIPPHRLHEPDGVAEVLADAMRALGVPEARIDPKTLRIAAADAYGSANQYFRAHPVYSRYRSVAGLVLMHHKVILDEALRDCQ